MIMTEQIHELTELRAKTLFEILKHEPVDAKSLLLIGQALREFIALGWDMRSDEIYKSPFEYCLCPTLLIDKLNALALDGWEPIMIDDSRIVMRRHKEKIS